MRNAEIGGHFDGELKVSDRLTVRGTGRVKGQIRYGRLEVTIGGQMRGDIAPAIRSSQSRSRQAQEIATSRQKAEAPERPSAVSILQPVEAAAPADQPAKSDIQPEADDTADGQSSRDRHAAE